MKSRWLTLIAALGFALTLSGQAFAKPPEEEAIDRAEKASERAAKAAERASEAAERASEREARDKADRDRDAGRDATKDVKDVVRKDAKDQSELILVKSEDSKPSGSTDGGSGDDKVSGSGDSSGESGGTSGGSDDQLSDSDDDDGDDQSGSNSGSGSSGSSDDDDDDDSDDDSSGKGKDDGKNDGRKFGIIPVENDGAGNPYREGELVVMSDDAGLVSRAQALGFGVIEQRPLESIGAVVARLRRPEGVTSNQALEMLRTREPASASGYNYLYRATGKGPEEKPQDTPISAPAPAPVHAKNKATSVGIIDGFAADMVGGWKVERLIDKPAMAGHGDAVTTILLRDLANAYGAEPDRLMLLDVMRGQSGAGAADVAALVFAFDRLVTAKVGVVNLSLAGPDHPALQRAVSQSLKSGMVVVAAVGNEGPAAPPAFPAAYDGVIGVSAVDGNGKPYLYSGRGPQVDIAALGVEVSSSTKGGELIGTSYAAPHVTAMIAGEKKRHAGGSIDALLTEFAQDAGAPGRDPVYGLGILTLDKPERLAAAQASQSSN